MGNVRRKPQGEYSPAAREAQRLIDEGQHGKALDVCVRALRKNPTDRQMLTLLSAVCVRGKAAFERGARCFRRAMRLAPPGDPLIVSLFATFASNSDRRDRKRLTEEILSSAQDESTACQDPLSLFFEAMARGQAGDHWMAVRLYKKVLSIAEKSFKPAWVNLGQEYFALGELEKAGDAFQTYLELDPYDPNTYEHLAKVYRKMGNAEKEREVWKRFLALDVRNLRKAICTTENPMEVYREILAECRRRLRALGRKGKGEK